MEKSRPGGGTLGQWGDQWESLRYRSLLPGLTHVDEEFQVLGALDVQEGRPGGARPCGAEGQRCEARVCLGRAQTGMATGLGWAG